MLFRRILDPATTERSWVAWLIAAGLTLVLFLAIGLAVGTIHNGTLWQGVKGRQEPIRPERIIFQALPPPATAAAAPATAPAPEAPGRPVRAPVTPPSGAVFAPDSGSSAGAAERPPSSIPVGIPNPASSAPPAGKGAAPPCTGPCLAGVRGGFRLSTHELTRAERDSMLKELGQSVPRLAKDIGGAGSRSSGLGGVSIDIGLPGGGPTKAQRTRDSTINADVTARLAIIRLRADSVVAARRRDSLEAVARRRRDSSTVSRGDPPW